MSLKEMLQTELPLNRKERFFTGTVFPMIVCKDNFKYIHLLWDLLRLSQIPAIISEPGKANILFFTEYSLVESLEKDTQKFRELPKTKDTPDIVIFIRSTRKFLIALEAKMYHRPPAPKLKVQMLAQQRMLKSIKGSLGVDERDSYHGLLLPEKFKAQIQSEVKFPVITWEEICKAFEPVCKNDYFLELLHVSLDGYDKLVSHSVAFGQNCEREMFGKEIVDRLARGELDMVSMGREGGIDGKRLDEDVTSGRWRTHQYETSSKKPGNGNWFLIEEFAKRVGQ